MNIKQYEQIGKLIREIRSDHNHIVRMTKCIDENYEKLKTLLPAEDVPALDELFYSENDDMRF